MTMEGNSVFRFAVRVLEEAVEELLAKYGLDTPDVVAATKRVLKRK